MATETQVREAALAASVTEGFVLQTERGFTTVADSVVAKIAGMATREVPGVHNLGTTFRRLVGRVRPGESLTQGVNVEVGKKETAIDLVVVVAYGYAIPSLAQEVRDNVIAKVEANTGLVVKEVNIEIDDLYIPSSEEPITSRVE